MTSSEPIQPNAPRQGIAFRPQAPVLDITASPVGFFQPENLPAPALQSVDFTVLTDAAARAANITSFLSERRKVREARQQAADAGGRELQAQALADADAQMVDPAAFAQHFPAIMESGKLQDWFLGGNPQDPVPQSEIAARTVSGTQDGLPSLRDKTLRKLRREVAGLTFLGENNPVYSEFMLREQGRLLADGVQAVLNTEHLPGLLTIKGPQDGGSGLEFQTEVHQAVRAVVSEVAQYAPDIADQGPRSAAFWDRLRGHMNTLQQQVAEQRPAVVARELREANYADLSNVMTSMLGRTMSPALKAEDIEKFEGRAAKDLTAMFRDRLDQIGVTNRPAEMVAVFSRYADTLLRETTRNPAERRERIDDFLRLASQVDLGGKPIGDTELFQAKVLDPLQRAHEQAYAGTGGVSEDLYRTFTNAQVDAILPVLEQINEVLVDGQFGDNAAQVQALQGEMLQVVRNNPAFTALPKTERVLVERRAIEFFRRATVPALQSPAEQDSMLSQAATAAENGRFAEAYAIMGSGILNASDPRYVATMQRIRQEQEGVQFKGPDSAYSRVVGPESLFGKRLSTVQSLQAQPGVTDTAAGLLEEVADSMDTARSAMNAAWRAELQRLQADTELTDVQRQAELDKWVQSTEARPFRDAMNEAFSKFQEAQGQARAQVSQWQSQRYMPTTAEWQEIQSVLGPAATQDRERALLEQSSDEALLRQTGAVRQSDEQLIRSAILRKVNADPDLDAKLLIEPNAKREAIEQEVASKMATYDRLMREQFRQVRATPTNNPIQHLADQGRKFADDIIATLLEPQGLDLETAPSPRTQAAFQSKVEDRRAFRAFLNNQSKPAARSQYVQHLEQAVAEDSLGRFGDLAKASAFNLAHRGDPRAFRHTVVLPAFADGPRSRPGILQSIRQPMEALLSDPDLPNHSARDQIVYDALRVSRSVVPMDSVLAGTVKAKVGSPTEKPLDVTVTAKNVKEWRPFSTSFFRTENELEAWSKSLEEVNAFAKLVGIPGMAINTGQFTGDKPRPTPQVLADFLVTQRQMIRARN